MFALKSTGRPLRPVAEPRGRSVGPIARERRTYRSARRCVHSGDALITGSAASMALRNGSEVRKSDGTPIFPSEKFLQSSKTPHDFVSGEKDKIIIVEK